MCCRGNFVEVQKRVAHLYVSPDDLDVIKQKKFVYCVIAQLKNAPDKSDQILYWRFLLV